MNSCWHCCGETVKSLVTKTAMKEDLAIGFTDAVALRALYCGKYLVAEVP